MALAKQNIFNTIRINNTIFIRPSDFTPQKEYVYAAEMTTCTGKQIADAIGWRWAEMTLEWDYLPYNLLNILMQLGTTATLQFDDMTGTTYTENVIITNAVGVGSRQTDASGHQVWHDIKLGVRFADVH